MIRLMILVAIYMFFVNFVHTTGKEIVPVMIMSPVTITGDIALPLRTDAEIEQRLGIKIVDMIKFKSFLNKMM